MGTVRIARPPGGRPLVKGFFEKRTSSVQYVVADSETKRCAIIDPVLDFDPKSGATATYSADELLAHIERGSLLGSRISEGPDRRFDRDRREGGRGSETLAGHLQHRGLPSRRRIANGTGSSLMANASRSATWMLRCCSRRATRSLRLH